MFKEVLIHFDTYFGYHINVSKITPQYFPDFLLVQAKICDVAKDVNAPTSPHAEPIVSFNFAIKLS